MNKSLRIMAALLLLVGADMTAFAADMGATCENCPTAQAPGVICGPWFDYESGMGYRFECDLGNRIIFTLCDCSRGSFNIGDDIPVRLTILTDGVYWLWNEGLDAAPEDGIADGADTATNAVRSILRDDVHATGCACDFHTCGEVDVTDVQYTFVLEDGRMIRTTVDAAGNLAGGSVEVGIDGSIIGPWCGGVSCPTDEYVTAVDVSVPYIDRIKTIMISNVHTVTAEDISSNLEKFYVDLPNLRYDGNRITPGDSVVVRVEYGKVLTCGACYACACERSIGTLLTPANPDYGDAPEPYPTLHVVNGARHAISTEYYLGSGLDAESDAHPDSNALGDDKDGNDDEDGVVLGEALFPRAQGSVTITASKNGFVNAWIDFNGDGDWIDAGEQIFARQAVTAGANPLNFTVPRGASVGRTFGRFRFSSTGNLSSRGPADDGEVEDYAVEILADTDGDGEPDINDGCPDDPEKIEAGVCGCGDSDTDSDGDGLADCIDNRPDDDGDSDPPDSDDNIETCADAPRPVSPRNGSTGTSFTPTLAIAYTADAGNCETHRQTRWQISEDSDFRRLTCKANTMGPDPVSYPVAPGVLKPDTTYYWRAKALCGVCESYYSEAFAFTTGPPSDDADGNGIPDDQATEGAADLNGDGHPDIQGDHFRGLNTVVGDALVAIETSGKIALLQSLDHRNQAISEGMPDKMPWGLLNFRIETANDGDTVRITIYFDEEAPDGSVFYKCDPENGWIDYSEHATFASDMKSVAIEIQDGGFGDLDGVVNGVIVDPCGVGVDDESTPPDGNDDGGNGGGCFLETMAVYH